MTDETRSGFIALIGAPNAGKSTLLNKVVGTKLAIVTHKVQTTRNRLLGIAMEGNSQLIFVDTPGIFKPKRRLDRSMVSSAWQGAYDADIIVLLVDAASGVDNDVAQIIKGLEKSKRKAILALNKIDAVNKEKLLGLAKNLSEKECFSEVFMISALKGSGVDDLKKLLAERVPQSKYLYPEDQITDVTQRSLAAEITREKIFLRLHQELPYSIWVATEKWENHQDGSVRLEQIIHVERDGHKGIVIGKGGKTLKAIGASARKDMEELLGHPVHLFLFVKVSENWTDSAFHFAEMGMEYVK
jgi:GTP-binding protein Era